MGVSLKQKNKKKNSLIDILDPKLRTIRKKFHLVVGQQVLRLSETAIETESKTRDQKQMEIDKICRAQLIAHDVEEECTETSGALDEAVDCCIYLDRNLISSKLLNKLNKHKVSLVKLQAMQLKSKVSKTQACDMSFTLKKKITEHEKFRWNNEKDSITAKEFNMDSKIDEEVFHHRCMQTKVILYDTKDEQYEEVQLLIKDEHFLCVGVDDAADHVCKKKRASFKRSKWIEITDSRSYRSIGTKFPILNLSLFTKTNPDGEVQGQTLLGKFATHEFWCTDKCYAEVGRKTSAQQLRNAIMGFFDHYRSAETREKYKALNCAGFENEFCKFEDYIKQYWSLKVCKRFCLSVRTNTVESFFSTRLFYVPKHLKFLRTYHAKMQICALTWNELHISDRYKKLWGASGIDLRKNWHQRVHARVFNEYQSKKFIEGRGRKITNTPHHRVIPEVMTQYRKKKRKFQ